MEPTRPEVRGTNAVHRHAAGRGIHVAGCVSAPIDNRLHAGRPREAGTAISLRTKHIRPGMKATHPGYSGLCHAMLMKGTHGRAFLPIILPKVMERRGEHAILLLTNQEILTDNARKHNDSPRDGWGRTRGQWRAGCAEQLGCRVHRDGRGRGERNGKAAGAEAQGSGAVSRHQDKFSSKG
jgi:hypothetical protein